MSHSGNTLRTGRSDVNSQVLNEGQPKIAPTLVSDHYRGGLREMVDTGDDLWALEVLIRMDVAGDYSKVQSNQHQEQVNGTPHSSDCAVMMVVICPRVSTFSTRRRRRACVTLSTCLEDLLIARFHVTHLPRLHLLSCWSAG